MRGKSLISTLLILALFTTLAMVNLGFSPGPTIQLSPVEWDPVNNRWNLPVANPPETFTLNVDIANAPAISGWEFKVTWDLSVLKFPPVVAETGFLSYDGLFGTDFKVYEAMQYNYIQAGSILTDDYRDYGLVPEEVQNFGTGTIATITFEVLAGGVSNITIYDVKLIDYYHANIVYTVSPFVAYFHTNKPFVDFTWTPAQPLPGDIVTFNASACWDPDGGGITNYQWDFGDGATETGTTPIANHAYTAYRFDAYKVSLTITDDDVPVPNTSSKVKSLRIWRDVKVVDIWPTFDDWDLKTVNKRFARGSLDYWGPTDVTGLPPYWPTLSIIGTLYNPGTHDEKVLYTVTATYQATGHVYPIDQYYIKLKAGASSGWAGWTYWWLLGPKSGWGNGQYIPSGKYTLTVSVVPFEGECDTTNNAMSIEIEVFEVGTDLINKHITSHSFSKSIHGDTMWFDSTIKNRATADSDIPAPGMAKVGTWVEFEIEDPRGETIVLKTSEIDQTTLAPGAEVAMEPLALNVKDLPTGTYTATAINNYYYIDTMTNDWNKLFQSEKVITFSFLIRP